MPRYKRTRDEAEMDLPSEPALPAAQQEILDRLRNMWEFASLMQYIFLFGHVVKIDDDFDIEDLEAECMKPAPSERLAQIGLQLLKHVSSHRGLTLEIFAEYTRRQYVAKAPQRNPFGEDEDPIQFDELDIFTRVGILQQLSTWTFGNVDRMRGLMPQDEDHLNWRMDPLGWDKDENEYFVLDDNRLYRRSDEPAPPPTPKPKVHAKAKRKAYSSSRSRATRASKRRKVEDTEDELDEPLEDEDVTEDSVMLNGETVQHDTEPGYGFTNKTWKCIAITLEDYQEFLANIFRSRDPNEKALRARIEQDVLPIIEKRAEALKQKEIKKLRDLENMEKMATAKRSSRLAGKAEKERQDREEREAEEKRLADLRMAREEQERQLRIEEGHESRRLTREQRVREREAKRILHEEELARLEEVEQAESHNVGSDAAEAKRASERQRTSQREQHKKELEKLAEDDGNWYFDCSVCGKHGENMDDGSHSIACDRCSVWQHSKCHGFSPKQAESEGFTFVCATCHRKEEDAKKPKIPPLKLVNRSGGSPETHKSESRPATANGQANTRLPDFVTRQLDMLDHGDQARPSPGSSGQLTGRPSLQPHGQPQSPSAYRYPPVGNFAPYPAQPMLPGGHHPPTPTGYAAPPLANGYSQHQQQHHFAHHGAVVSSGGHFPYHQNGQPNEYSPHAAGVNYSAPQPPHFQYQQQSHYNQYQSPPHPQQRPGSSQLMNGFQSPVKQPGYHRSSPQTVMRTPQPTPSNGFSGSQSAKSHNQLSSPQMSASNVAQDGMSGPWPGPGGSKAIPQKHDQSPAPPSSSHSIGEKKIFPPHTPLVPSPSQQSAAVMGSIPVKRMPDLSPPQATLSPRSQHREDHVVQLPAQTSGQK